MPEVVPAVPEPQTDPGAFDADAFATKMLGEFDKRINAMDKRFNKLAEQFKPKPADPQPEPVADPTAPELKGDAKTIAELNAKLSNITRHLENETKEKEASKKLAAESESKRLETERISSFDSAIAEFEFADPSRRQLFRKAHLGDIVRDEDGNLVANTDKGPMAFSEYLKGQFEAQPWLMTPAGHSGAGASAGKKAFGGQKVDVLSMTTEQIAKLPQSQRAELLAQNLSLVNEGQ